MKKFNEAYKSIGEVAKILNLINKKNGSLNTHTIRFWEKEFKSINPIKLAGRRRYYDEKSIEVLKKIKFLLKDQGMTIKGAKRALRTQDPFNLDDSINKSINKDKKNLVLKKKVTKISKLIKEIKNLK
ncbi:MAG TPA: MerR family transcriptional regulator [Candidatus Pelagibacter bacterium]|jgi:DNA-binding transcriptional MerR regulator|nr:transcriptional regulator [Pelagibacteraceae bacterium]HJN84564.1 MerR family transcriptional regulator [Candidatus Pelagibacter bacterium]|tara:strand:+ start:1250 stop:1633 length:384 start_codon:yes stop_codon:yes gene_type:complete